MNTSWQSQFYAKIVADRESWLGWHLPVPKNLPNRGLVIVARDLIANIAKLAGKV